MNFFKRQKIAHVVRTVQHFQQTPYAFQIVPIIKEFFSSIVVLDEEEGYELSLQREQKQVKAKRMIDVDAKSDSTE